MDRKAAVQRMVADKVLADESIFTTPVEDLSDAQAAMLEAALRGPHADEIMAAMSGGDDTDAERNEVDHD